MDERQRLLRSIASIIGDYQSVILPMPDAAHVDRWIGQFASPVQLPILAEMEHVLRKSYFPAARVDGFIRSVIRHRPWTNGDAAAFWRQVNFLDLQPRGNSQREFIAAFDSALKSEIGLSVADCGQSNRFIYIDDGLFSGGRLGTDLEKWIYEKAPPGAQLFIAVIASHTQGRFFTGRALDQANLASGKKIGITWGSRVTVEDGLFEVDNADVLRPTGPGGDRAVAAYVASLGKEPTWRNGNSLGPLGWYSSSQGRHLIEQEFLKMGVAVRAMSGNFNDYQRPLGNTTMRTLGFGTMFATYRNCPNNAPLVLWAGDPWYPLLRRRTN